MSFKKPSYTKAIWTLFSNSDLLREITLQVEHSTTPILNRSCGAAMIASSHVRNVSLAIAMAAARVRARVSPETASLRNPIPTAAAGAPPPPALKRTYPAVKLVPLALQMTPVPVQIVPPAVQIAPPAVEIVPLVVQITAPAVITAPPMVQMAAQAVIIAAAAVITGAPAVITAPPALIIASPAANPSLTSVPAASGKHAKALFINNCISLCYRAPLQPSSPFLLCSSAPRRAASPLYRHHSRGNWLASFRPSRAAEPPTITMSRLTR